MRKIPWLVLAAVLLCVPAGCVPAYGSVGYTTWADASPPAPYMEEAGAAPGPGYVWVNGYWYWSGAQWQWMRGYWAPVPAVGYAWQPSGWIQVSGRYRFVPGRWVAPHHHPQVRYVHPVPRVRVEVRGAPYRAIPPRHDRQGRRH